MTAAARSVGWFPWAEVLETGLTVLRLAPSEFWAMTPREFAWCAGLGRAAVRAVPARSELDALMTAFPDI